MVPEMVLKSLSLTLRVFSNKKNILYIFVILIICHAKFSRATPLEYEDSEFSGTQYYRSDNC